MDISIKVTVPKEILRMSIVQDSIAQVMTKKTAPEVKTLFRKTVYGWKSKNKPSFRQRLDKRANYMSETIWADGNSDVYQMVNFGTDPHPINPKGPGYPLRFKWGGKGSYKPATKPGIIQSNRAYKNGPIVTPWAIKEHPGIKDPRRFDEAIKKEYEPTFVKDIHDAISVAAAKSAAESNK